MPGLSEYLSNRLMDELHHLMYQYEYNPMGSDYSCAFCQMRPPKNGYAIEHSPDCLGEAIKNEMENP